MCKALAKLIGNSRCFTEIKDKCTRFRIRNIKLKDEDKTLSLVFTLPSKHS